MKHISPTLMYIIPMYLRLITFTKILPQMLFHLYLFAIIISLWAPPMTLLTVGALTVPQLCATASNVCTTDARPSGVGRTPPQTKIIATPVCDNHGKRVDIRRPGENQWKEKKEQGWGCGFLEIVSVDRPRSCFWWQPYAQTCVNMI